MCLAYAQVSGFAEWRSASWPPWKPSRRAKAALAHIAERRPVERHHGAVIARSRKGQH